MYYLSLMKSIDDILHLFIPIGENEVHTPKEVRTFRIVFICAVLAFISFLAAKVILS